VDSLFSGCPGWLTLHEYIPDIDVDRKSPVNRRGFIAGAVGAGATVAGVAAITTELSPSSGGPSAGGGKVRVTNAASATAALSIPDLLSATTTDGVSVFALDAQTGTHNVLASVTSSTAGFNGSFLGPTIKVTNGESVQINVTNNLGADSTVHWHGAHVHPKWDGGPQEVIADGGTWSPAFTVNQQATTLWYHPHALGTTAQQISQGLAGMLIVTDDSATSAALPSDYGVDDIPIILQCLAVDDSGDIKYDLAGYLGTADLNFPVLCNGTNVDDTTLTFTATRKRTRLRFLNASLSDIITIQRGDGGTLTQIATEQGYLTSATEVSTIRLVAGSRAEAVLDLTDAVTLQAVITTGWVAGGSGTYDVLTITPDASDTPADLPATLNTITRIDTSALTVRTIQLTQSGLSMGINGVIGTSMDAMDSNMIAVTLGTTELWSIVNTTQLEHSFHVHDVPFQIISSNGAEPTGVDLGWKDTVEVIGGSTVNIAMTFSDYADDTYYYMLHCHIAQHEDEGMMTALKVSEA
jgi:FtsP/CotA-like multicopper oxidase with cupredoxin domain